MDSERHFEFSFFLHIIWIVEFNVLQVMNLIYVSLHGEHPQPNTTKKRMNFEFYNTLQDQKIIYLTS
jgi:hypothetical protein